MNQARGREREDALRADVARLVQVMRHHLPARDVPPEIEPLLGPVRHLAALLDADAPAGLLQDAALSVVDIYEWPSPDASGGDEGPVIDPAILAAVERLRDACDALDEADGGYPGNQDDGLEDEPAPPAGQAPA